MTFEVMFTNELNKIRSEQIIPLFAYNLQLKCSRSPRDNSNYIPSKRSCTLNRHNDISGASKQSTQLCSHTCVRERERKTHDSSRIRSFHYSKPDPAKPVTSFTPQPTRSGRVRPAEPTGIGPIRPHLLQLSRWRDFSLNQVRGRKFACHWKRER